MTSPYATDGELLRVARERLTGGELLETSVAHAVLRALERTAELEAANAQAQQCVIQAERAYDRAVKRIAELEASEQALTDRLNDIEAASFRRASVDYVERQEREAMKARIAELEQAVLTKTTLQESAEAQLLCVQVQLDAAERKVEASERDRVAALAEAVRVHCLLEATETERDAAYERGRADERASLPAPRQLSAAEMAEATAEARELRAALDRATDCME